MARYGRVRTFLWQGLSILEVVGGALCIFLCICVASGTDAPLMVVLSGSMEPMMYRGDLIWIAGTSPESLRVGDVAVYRLPGRDIPIVHRVMSLHHSRETAEGKPEGRGQQEGKLRLLMKGDNNSVDDRQGGIFPADLPYLDESHVVGRVLLVAPYLGWFSLWMQELPLVKWLLLLGGLVFLLFDSTKNKETQTETPTELQENPKRLQATSATTTNNTIH